VTHEEVSFEELGGADVHGETSGVAHAVYSSEPECLAAIRELLAFLPSNNLDEPPLLAADDADDRRDESLLDVIPLLASSPYDMHDVIRPVVDHGQFFEIMAGFAGNVLVGFARLGGRPVGVVANQPAVLAGVRQPEARHVAVDGLVLAGADLEGLVPDADVSAVDPDGFEVALPRLGVKHVLTREALEFIAELARKFAPRVEELLARREARQREIDAGRLPIDRGFEVEPDDLLRRDIITQIMCNFFLDIPAVEKKWRFSFAEKFKTEIAELQQMQTDGLLKLNAKALEVLPAGRLLVRNICMVFDHYLKGGGQSGRFSKVI